jgi:Protein of unknown function (DUF1573)
MKNLGLSMKTRCFILVSVALVFGGISFGLRSGLIVRTWNAQFSPVVEVDPDILELGNRELGEVVVCPFSISNRGHKELVIDDIHSTCACLGFEREVDGDSQRVDSLILSPGERVTLLMRLSVRGLPGSSMRNAIAFRTNDPMQPLARVETYVSSIMGGVLTEPASVVFGEMQEGVIACQEVNIYDHCIERRSVKEVNSSDSDRFSVDFTPVEQMNIQDQPVDNRRLLGRAQIRVNTRVIGSVNGHISIQLKERILPTQLPVIGRVVPLVEITPEILELPRASQDGPVYFATCCCRCTGGGVLDLTVEEASTGITASILSSKGESSTRLVRIEYHPESEKVMKQDPVSVVKLRAKIDGKTIPLTVQVRLRQLRQFQ